THPRTPLTYPLSLHDALPILNLGVTGVYDRTEGTEGKSDVISLGLQSSPIFPVYNENGNLGFKDPNSSWYRFAQYTDLQLWHPRSEEHTSELQSRENLVCRLL